MDESTSNEGSATTDGNALPNRNPPDVTRSGRGCQAGAGAPRTGPNGVAVPDGSGQRPHSAPLDQHRLPLALESRETPAAVAIALEAWITTISHESEFWPHVHVDQGNELARLRGVGFLAQQARLDQRLRMRAISASPILVSGGRTTARFWRRSSISAPPVSQVLAAGNACSPPFSIV